jgi:diguanylate cyclase (GGDEF)-like protein
MPLMVDGKRQGVALFASPLSDVVSAFYQITKADIALLMPEASATTRGDIRALSDWHVSVPTITNANQMYPLLLHTAADHSLSELESGVIRQLGTARFRITAVPLSRFSQVGNGYWVLINDVSDALADIETAIRNNWLYGTFGLAMAELLLGVLLWRPLSRLRATAETLPLLGQGAFQRAREIIAIRQRRQRTLLADESDLLDDTAISLSHRLEYLESTVSARTEKLRQQAAQLEQDRDFIQHLLDTAQAVILTQNREGRILSINAFGIRMLESAGETWPAERSFDELFISDVDAEIARISLQEIADGKLVAFQHDASIDIANEQPRDVAWRHARLQVGSGEYTVLSVGLDVSEQRKAERQIAWLADHDQLTNLFNRRRFQEELRRALTEATRFGQVGGLLYLDLDQFKFINDAGGHAVGDSLLKAVALILKKTVRTTDIVSRLGGDEFAILLPQTDTEGATVLAEKVRAALRNIQLEVGGRPQRITTSIGIALYPEHGIDVHDLLATADMAMYQAKAGGRDRWQLYSADTMGREFIRSMLATKTTVEEALAEERLEFHYQPILDLHTNSISHVEALLRLRLPDGKLMMPDQFIGVAERTGTIREIDRYVLRLAAKEIRRFLDAGFDLQISINQSAFALDDPSLPSIMTQLLEEEPMLAGRLIIEITESAAVTNVMSTNEIFRTIQEMGCQLAIDDFGTGFSSLNYLKQLPVDYIKIDGVFVRDVVDKPDDQILMLAVIELAHMFGKVTIAEHVGRQDVCDWLQAHGVDFAQGYLIARPMPRADLYDFLTARGSIPRTSGRDRRPRRLTAVDAGWSDRQGAQGKG